MALYSFVMVLALGPPAEPASVAYKCLDDTTFVLVASPSEAIVRFADGQYRLPRRPSAIATKYANETATLYLDGDFAAFIADDRPLPGCVRARAGSEVGRP